MSEPVDPDLTRYLATRNAPCPSGGYNLRGTQSDICSECGLKLNVYMLIYEAEHPPADSILLVLGLAFAPMLMLAIGFLLVAFGSVVSGFTAIALMPVAAGVSQWLLRRVPKRPDQ